MPDLLRGQALTQPALQPAERYVDLRLLQMLGIFVQQTGDLHLRVQVGEQLHGQIQSLIAALRVDGLFVAGGGLGAVVVPQGGAADAGGLEVGDLQNDLVGGGEDGVLGAAPTPAIYDAASSAMVRSSVLRGSSLPLSSVSVSPALARRTMMCPAMWSES